MKDRHLKKLSMKDEIISLLKEKLATERKNADLSLGGGSSISESLEGDKVPPKVAEERTSKKMTLPTPQKFSGDGDAFDRWLQKFSHYAELEHWKVTVATVGVVSLRESQASVQSAPCKCKGHFFQSSRITKEEIAASG